uniref:Secreted protein n=1 Tax=Anopheles maculatus TaxID=74869 RepID=A0A182T1T9_9DIPT
MRHANRPSSCIVLLIVAASVVVCAEVAEAAHGHGSVETLLAHDITANIEAPRDDFNNDQGGLNDHRQPTAQSHSHRAYNVAVFTSGHFDCFPKLFINKPYRERQQLAPQHHSAPD